jgi:hypothetical protein
MQSNTEQCIGVWSDPHQQGAENSGRQGQLPWCRWSPRHRAAGRESPGLRGERRGWERSGEEEGERRGGVESKWVM